MQDPAVLQAVNTCVMRIPFRWYTVCHVKAGTGAPTLRLLEQGPIGIFLRTNVRMNLGQQSERRWKFVALFIVHGTVELWAMDK